MDFFCFCNVFDCSGNAYFVLPLLCSLTVYFVFLLTAVYWRERARIVDDNAHVKGHGRRHANSNDSISS